MSSCTSSYKQKKTKKAFTNKKSIINKSKKSQPYHCLTITVTIASVVSSLVWIRTLLIVVESNIISNFYKLSIFYFTFIYKLGY